VLAISAALATACGSSRGSDGGDEAGSTSTTAAATKDATFGTLDSPCGEGDAKGATDVGVADDGITIGYGDDAGYSASPGLNHEMSDAMKAMIKWCNDQGGINGREVVGTYYDAKLTEVTNAMTQACEDKVFFLVGEGWALDSAQEQARLGCGLPAMPGYSVSAAFANGPKMIQAVPNPIDYTPVQYGAAIAKAFPEKIKKSAVMFANYAATQETKDKVLATFPSLGYKFLDCPQEYNIAGESDWKPFVQKLKSCGAEVVYWTGSPYPNYENYLEAADQLGYHPIHLVDANFYDQAFAKWNTNGFADDTYIREAYLPLEEADTTPAIQQYLDIVQGDGGDVNQLGEQATSSFLLWATGVKACGSNVTRDCVLDEIAKVKDWTGGGLHAPTDPASNMPPTCGVTLKLDGTKFVRFDPAEKGKLDCSDDYVVKVTGSVVDAAQLGPDRISTKFSQ
jgi:ABC-type branched-subunit amino acid transport system substrate-binding protein